MPEIAHIRETIFGNLKRGYERVKDPAKVGVSELCWCVRRSYYNRMNPIPPDEKTLIRFMRGRSLHDLILLCFDNREVKIEIPLECGKIIRGYADALVNDTLIELKTVKTYKWDSEHIQQLKYYMAALGKTSGCLIYHNVFSDELKFIPVNLTDGERHTVLCQLKNIADDFFYALETMNPSILPTAYIPDLCKSCVYKIRCKGDDIVRT